MELTSRTISCEGKHVSMIFHHGHHYVFAGYGMGPNCDNCGQLTLQNVRNKLLLSTDINVRHHIRYNIKYSGLVYLIEEKM